MPCNFGNVKIDIAFLSIGKYAYGIMGDCCTSATPLAQVPGPSGANAWAVVTTPFTVPAISANVTVSVNQSAGFVAGQNVYIATSSTSGGNFQIYQVNSTNTVTLTFLGFSGDFVPGTVVAVNSLMVPGTGNVVNLSTVGFTTTTANFTITNPPFNTPITVGVASAAPFIVGQNIFIGNATQQINALIQSVSVSGKTITFIPLGFPGDSLSGTVNSGANVMSGVGNSGGFGTAVTLTRAFTVPTTGAAAATAFISDMNFQNASGPMYVAIFSSGNGTYGEYVVTPSASSSQLTLLPTSSTANLIGGTTLPIGSIVIPIGSTHDIGYVPGTYLTAALGSGYSLNAPGGGSPVANGVVTIGATAAALSLTLPGTYLIFARANIDYTKGTDTGVTFPVSGGGTGLSHVTLKLRNITAGADVTGTTTNFIPRVGASAGITTQMGTADIVQLPVGVVTLALNASLPTAIQLWAVIDTSPSVGIVEIMEASLVAIKIA